MRKLTLLIVVAFVVLASACAEKANVVNYERGMFVEKNGAKGVVFYVDDTTVKIISAEKSSEVWSTECADVPTFDWYNGANNMARVTALEDWEIKYPAFKWCADLGEGWYLPALEELREVYKYFGVVNATLSANGYDTLDMYDEKYCWSSTTTRSNTNPPIHYLSALGCSFRGNFYGDSPKDEVQMVRGVLAFKK